MNNTQHDWMIRMTANLELMNEQYRTTGIDNTLKTETSRKIQEAVRRLQKKTAMGAIINEEEYAAANEFWDGEADSHVEWLAECLRIIAIYTAEPDDDGFNEEKEYEKEMDRRYRQFHGDVPLWAQ